MGQLANIGFLGLTFAYPALVYGLLTLWGPAAVGGLICVLGAGRIVWIALPQTGDPMPAATPGIWQAVALAGLMIAAGSGAWYFDRDDSLLLYPVVVNLVLFTAFAHSAIFPPTLVERIARLKDPDLPPAAVRYTHRVTLVWCGFFVVNGSISLYTGLVASREVWALYNGVIAYVAMAALFAGEFAVRQFVVRR
jgi:uncharacterized membrane protein